MAGVLSNLSDALAEAVETVSPSVVRVDGRSRMPASGIVWSSDGIIVTAHHGVHRDGKISVARHDGKTVPVALVGRDPSTDLAVLRAEAKGLTAPNWAEASDLHVGHLVLALSRPGRSVRATLGIVSALEQRGLAHARRRPARPLPADRCGHVPRILRRSSCERLRTGAGVNTSAMLRGTALTVPYATIRQEVETLLAHGRIRQGYLGVSAQAVPLPASLAEQHAQETGLLLVTVEPDSPAELGGLLLGDTIVALEDTPMRHLDDLLANLSGDRIGKTVSVRVIRGGQAQELTVTVGERSYW